MNECESRAMQRQYVLVVFLILIFLPVLILIFVVFVFVSVAVSLTIPARAQGRRAAEQHQGRRRVPPAREGPRGGRQDVRLVSRLSSFFSVSLSLSFNGI